MTKRISRRRLFAIGIGAAAGIVAGRNEAAEAAIEPMDVCFWYGTDRYICDNGTLLQLWCFRCCTGLECEEWWCEWRNIGGC